MKQLLFLLLFPCLALAQYQGNANQKITLGEQTTADGLVYRGVASIDTVTATSKITRTNKQDTSAFLLLDTVTNLLWHYKIGSNAWIQAGGSPLTNPVTGTGTTNYIPKFTSSSAIGNSAIYDSSGTIGIGTTLPTQKLDVNGKIRATDDLILAQTNPVIAYDNGTTGALRFASDGGSIERMRITSAGNVGIGTASPAVQFHTTGGVRFAGLASITDLRTDADGDLFNGSDFNLKNSIDTINFGLSDVLKLKPVSFNWNDEQRNINEYKSMGFIAQDVMNIIPNAASTMGDGDMQVDYNAIVATLTKAIQEQQALIKALEQRILILENK